MQLETFEPRRLMSVSLNTTTGLLTANGSTGNDVITAKVESGVMKISVKNEGKATQYQNFAAHKVKQLVVNGHAGGDQILLMPSVKIPSVLNTGAGGTKQDVVQGGSGNDVININAYGASVNGKAGNDTVVVFKGKAEIYGDLGDDTYVDKADTARTNFYGGQGTDTVDFSAHTKGLLLRSAGSYGDHSGFYSPGSSSLEVTAANRFMCFGVDNFIGGQGDDHIYGTEIGNVLKGNGGKDQLYGLGGNDQLYGGSGNDSLFGGSGNDSLYGQLGDDKLSAYDSVKDVLDGGAGTDSATYDKGLDEVSGA